MPDALSASSHSFSPLHPIMIMEALRPSSPLGFLVPPPPIVIINPFSLPLLGRESANQEIKGRRAPQLNAMNQIPSPDQLLGKSGGARAAPFGHRPSPLIKTSLFQLNH